MNHLIKILSFFLLTISLNAQVASIEISRDKKDIFPNGAGLISSDLYISSLIRTDVDTLSRILIYDTISLQLKDSISSIQTGRRHAHFRDIFRFNDKDYVLVISNDLRKYGWSVHQIQGNSLVDSNSLGLDTLLRPFVANLEVLGSNKLRLYVYTFAPNHFNSINTRIIDVDSNFNIIAHHVIDASNLGFAGQSAKTFHAHEVSDSMWHVYNSPVMHYYNPQTKTIDSTFYLWKDIRASLKVSPNEYLALGEVAGTKHFMGIPNSANTGLGFYRMRKSGSIIDTTVYFARAEVQSPIFTLYAMPRLHSASFLYSDTNNIYLACSNSFSGIVGAPQEGSILVVKTNSKGAEQWRYLWSGQKLSSAVFKILPTINGGCIVVGAYAYQNDNSIGMIIKFGPDGTISNVEVDGPENLVAFYPNPVKNKLHFDYLPEAKGQYTLELIDMNGKPVFKSPLNAETGFIPVQLNTGFYIYQLTNKKGEVVQVGKLVAE